MSNFSLKTLSNELRNNSIKNREDNDVRKSMTLRLNHKDEEKDLEENKIIIKIIIQIKMQMVLLKME